MGPEGYLIDGDGSVFFDRATMTEQDVDELLGINITEEDWLRDQAGDLKNELFTLLAQINCAVVSGKFTQTEVDQLIVYQGELWDMRDLPGTPQELRGVLDQIMVQVSAILSFRFRFEP